MYSTRQRHRIYKRALALTQRDWSAYQALMRITNLNYEQVKAEFPEIVNSYKEYPVGTDNVCNIQRMYDCIYQTRTPNPLKAFITNLMNNIL